MAIVDITPLQTLYEIMGRFEKSLRAMSYEPTSYQLEQWAMVVVDSMSGPARLYHRADHIIELSENMDPIATLAALYHDIVYYQVDGGLAPCLHSIIAKYFFVINGVLYASSSIENDAFYDIALTLFEIQPGQKLLPNSGQNEFLSALVAMLQLKEIVSLKELVMIATCIEATIPFRGNQPVMQGLCDRLKKINKKYKLGLTQKDLVESIQRATRLANKDVANFADYDIGVFLDNTWKLLPETNARLSETFFYSIREYRLALQKMEGFLSNLLVESIFQQFDGVPSQTEFNKINQQARENLRLAKQYLQIKLYATIILEALAHTSGGDAPLIYFMGEIHHTSSTNSLRMEAFLPPAPVKQSENLNPVLLYLFEHGRRVETTFDRKTSPLSAYLYRLLGDIGMKKAFSDTQDVINNRLSYEKFLYQQNHEMIHHIALACSKVASSRNAALISIANKFKNLSPSN